MDVFLRVGAAVPELTVAVRRAINYQIGFPVAVIVGRLRLIAPRTESRVPEPAAAASEDIPDAVRRAPDRDVRFAVVIFDDRNVRRRAEEPHVILAVRRIVDVETAFQNIPDPALRRVALAGSTAEAEVTASQTVNIIKPGIIINF